MVDSFNISSIYSAVSKSPLFANLEKSDLEKLPTKGLSHDHFRITSSQSVGRQPLIRVPRLSQLGLDPITNINYQSAAFERASKSGHVPKLIERIEPTDRLPSGALVVEEIDGKPVNLPEDLVPMAECFARVHSINVPIKEKHSPLISQDDPLLGVMHFIEKQSPFVNVATQNSEVRRLIDLELGWARQFASENKGTHPPVSLCLTDTHPGNFLIEPNGKVYFVDLEKALYGSPAVDLGHATVLTSTLWDIDVQARLTRSEVRLFYEAYLNFLPQGRADAIRPWLLPMRRLAWLRSTTWGCKWLAEQEENKNPNSEVLRHTQERLSAFVELETIYQVRSEWVGDDPLVLD